MSELEKLRARMIEKNVTHAHVWWGPGAAELTPEERAGHLNAAQDQVDAFRALPDFERLMIEHKRLADSVREVKALLRFSVRELPPEAALRSDCFHRLDMALLICNELRRHEAACSAP